MWERHVTFGLGSINKSREPCTDTGKCRAVRIVRAAGVSPIKLVKNSVAELPISAPMLSPCRLSSRSKGSLPRPPAVNRGGAQQPALAIPREALMFREMLARIIHEVCEVAVSQRDGGAVFGGVGDAAVGV